MSQLKLKSHWSWLGGAVLAAGLVAAALLQVDGLAFAQSAPPPAPRIPTQAPRITTPPVQTPAPTGRAPTLEEVQAARLQASNTSAMLNCTGPLRVQVQQRDPNDARSPTHFSVFFRPAASATNVRAGQCWRTGGWGNGALIDMSGEGVIYYETRLGNCALLRSMRIENGNVAEWGLVDSYAPRVMLEMGTRAGLHTIETKYGGSITEAGSGPRLFNAQRPEYGFQPSHCVNR